MTGEEFYCFLKMSFETKQTVIRTTSFQFRYGIVVNIQCRSFSWTNHEVNLREKIFRDKNIFSKENTEQLSELLDFKVEQISSLFYFYPHHTFRFIFYFTFFSSKNPPTVWNRVSCWLNLNTTITSQSVLFKFKFNFNQTSH